MHRGAEGIRLTVLNALIAGRDENRRDRRDQLSE
jgi:hypothetical protein